MSDTESEIASQASDLEDYTDDESPKLPVFKVADEDIESDEQDSADDDDDDDDGSDNIFKPAIKIGKIVPSDGIEIADLDSDEDDEEKDEEKDEADDEDNIVKTAKSRQRIPTSLPKTQVLESGSEDNEDATDDDDDDEGEDDNDEPYMQKLDREIVSSYIQDMHPESLAHNYDEVRALTNVVRNKFGIVIDELHRTIPVMTKFEKTRILGIRGKQLDDGAQPFVKVPVGVIDGYTIAIEELTKKVIPFIIKRPLPNGGVEYWRAADLEIV